MINSVYANYRANAASPTRLFVICIDINLEFSAIEVHKTNMC